MEQSIIQTEYSELMQKSYIDYAMSVIISRALPDVRDGLNRYRDVPSMICMNWEFVTISLIERVRVLLVIPWVNIIRMEILPFMTHLL